MPAPSFDKVAPVIPVRDLTAALERFQLLGFVVHAYPGPDRYGYADRGGISLHLSESRDHDPARSDASIYLYVSDADAVHAEWVGAGVNGRFIAPHDTPYQLREFGLVDPDGTAIRVGSPITN